MRFTTVVSMVALAAALSAAPAHAAPPVQPQGGTCGLTTVTSLTGPPGWQSGVVYAGPLVTGETGTLFCSVHVNNNTHNGVAKKTVTATTVGGVVAVLAPTKLDYEATAADDVSLCTEWDGASGTLYWVRGNTLATPPQPGHWSTNAADTCGVALSIEPNDPECSIWKAIDNRLGTNIAEIWQDCDSYPPFF